MRFEIAQFSGSGVPMRFEITHFSGSGGTYEIWADSYRHLTMPTNYSVSISGVGVSLKKK